MLYYYTCGLQGKIKFHSKIVLMSNGKLPNCALLVLAMLANVLAVKGRAVAKKGENSQEYKNTCTENYFHVVPIT